MESPKHFLKKVSGRATGNVLQSLYFFDILQLLLELDVYHVTVLTTIHMFRCTPGQFQEL